MEVRHDRWQLPTDIGRLEKLPTGEFGMSRVEDAMACAIPFGAAGFLRPPVEAGARP